MICAYMYVCRSLKLNKKMLQNQLFEIPEFLSYNESVRKSIKTGIVSSKARRDIIQTLRTLIVQKTKFPNSVQYVTVSRKLIAKYPKLRDSKKLGSNGYVS